MIVLVILISTHMQIPHNAAESNAGTGAICYRAATATPLHESILLISNSVTGIHHLQLNCGTESSNTIIPTWGPVTVFSKVVCFMLPLK